MSIHLSFSKTKKIKSLQDQIETLNSNIQNLNGELNRLNNSWQRLSQEFSSLQNNSHQDNTAINESKSKQDKSEQDLLKIKQEMEHLHFATYDGSLIWIVEEFKKKFSKKFFVQNYA
jgi:predicted  nucleic acid-binding Zn-ribbon protein